MIAARGVRKIAAAQRLDLRHKRIMQVPKILWWMMASTLALHTGCDPGDEDEDEAAGEVEFRPIGGVWLNTSSIGPLLFSELDLDGQVLDGLVLTDVLLQRPGDLWLRMDSVEVVSGEIRGKRGETYYQGADLVGSRWLLSPVQGAPLEIWISGYTVISSTQTRYTFQTLDSGGAPVHVCDADSQGDHSAIPIKDITVDRETGDITPRARTLYLACVSGAVGKARVWGYDPGSLADFEVAVRMVRADYCYDGASWTVPGTGVQVRDAWDINGFLYPDYANEAVWTTTGVACLKKPRRTLYSASQVKCNGASIPTCSTNVGMTTYANTLFWTKVGAQ
jgi:hypothetical protein